MPLNFNGTSIDDLRLNGTSIDVLKLNGTTVWERATADLVPTPNFDVYRSGATCTATITFKTDKTYEGTASAGASRTGTYSGIWLDGGTAADYQIRLTATTGSFTTNAASSYVTMSSNRSATLDSGIGSSSVTFKVDIRRVSDLVVVHTETGCVMTAERTA